MEKYDWDCLTKFEHINHELYEEKLEITRFYYPMYFLRMIFFYVLLLVLTSLKLLVSVYQIFLAFFVIIFSFITKVLKLDRKKLPRSRSEVLEETYNEKNIHLILDLDNTLIFSTFKKIDNIKDYTVMDNLYVYKRPFLDKILNDASKYCEISIYTSGLKEYANPIIDYIDKNKVIGKRLYRQDCFKKNEIYCKDFLKHGFDSKKVIIVDDSPEVHLNSKDNLIPIKKWIGSPFDDSLLKISKTLSNLKYSEDVRGMIKSLININEPQ